MSDTFNAVIPSVTVSGIAANNPFFQIATPATTGITILQIELYQETSTSSTQTGVTLSRRTTASTLPTTVTPASLSPGETYAGTSAAGIATVTGTQGTILARWGFNILNGVIWVPVPEARLVVAPSSWMTLEFPLIGAPAVSFSGNIIFMTND